MVICLEEATLLALGQDDECIYDLVELRQIENPSIEGQALIPDSAHISRFWCESICGKVKDPVGDSPCTGSRVVSYSVAMSSWSMEFAQSIDGRAKRGMLVQGW